MVIHLHSHTKLTYENDEIKFVAYENLQDTEAERKRKTFGTQN
jgi:hypothetical protein